VELFVVFKSSSTTTFDLDSTTFAGPGVGTPGAVTSGPITSASGKCVDADGTQLVIWSCHGGVNQRWTLP
jgi:cytochrome c